MIKNFLITSHLFYIKCINNFQMILIKPKVLLLSKFL